MAIVVSFSPLTPFLQQHLAPLDVLRLLPRRQVVAPQVFVNLEEFGLDLAEFDHPRFDMLPAECFCCLEAVALNHPKARATLLNPTNVAPLEPPDANTSAGACARFGRATPVGCPGGRPHGFRHYGELPRRGVAAALAAMLQCPGIVGSPTAPHLPPGAALRFLFSFDAVALEFA